jgi:transposase
MPKSHPPYPPELRHRLVEMVRAGRSPAELAEQFEPSEQCIRNWAKQADRDSGRRQDGLTTAEKEELGRLRRENRALREERAILAKAAAWFARETRKIPGGSSDS